MGCNFTRESKGRPFQEKNYLSRDLKEIRKQTGVRTFQEEGKTSECKGFETEVCPAL
jgi:hypothetical protein